MSQPSFPFKKNNTVAFKKPASVLTQDAIYWKNLGVCLHANSECILCSLLSIK